MIRFNSDYQEGAHPRILEKLVETNFAQSAGYGEDEFCEQARATIRGRCEAPDAEVQFLVGGTQANFTMIAHTLRGYQGVIAASTAHIAVHETGSVEACGFKVLALPESDGKISAEQIDEYCALHFSDESHEHIVMPGMVYLSEPTELGTIYTLDELKAMRAVCDRWALKLYVDGARLGYGMASAPCDVTLPALARIADAFYIGGTKQGALFGEAMVILNDEMKRNFRYTIKQKGGMLAKGRLLGIQFEELFRGDLYHELSKHAIDLAMRLKKALADMGIAFLVDSPTNQQFPILKDSAIEKLREDFSFSYQKRIDAQNSAIRFCTSWATKPEDVEKLIEAVRMYR